MKSYVSNAHLLFYLTIAFFAIDLNLVGVFGESLGHDSASYIVTCGSKTKETDADNREWIPDDKFIASAGNNSVTASAQSQDPSLPSPVPYMSARIFTAESSYQFSVSSKSRMWLRLHFYPSTYSNLSPSESFFAVTANELTLLRNFSTSITAQALTQAYIIREFLLAPVASGILKVTFTPTSDRNYAFINGIEVITMPNLFETQPPMVGFSDQSVDLTTSTMQTMFRLNVGGQYIPSTNDSGLTRIWYDDTPYLFGAAIGVTSQAPQNVTIKYSNDIPKDIAPRDVYSTARTMGPDPKVNQNMNLTWVFAIDANFTYVVRFHFCEYFMERINQRVFDIYVNNQTAQESADVIAWSGSKGVPIFKDYATYASGGAGDNSLWVALHPSMSMKPEYYDSILNGLEIFKVNDTTGNLAGPNPVPSPMLVKAEAGKSFSPLSSFNRGPVVTRVAGGFAGFMVVVVVLFAVCRHKSKGSISPRANSGVGYWLPLYGSSYSSANASKSSSSGNSTASSHLSTLAAGLCRHFSLIEIRQATKNFSESQVIGVGGFGKVYKGVIDGGATKVAIKRSNPSSEQGIHEFQTEIEMLSKLRHKHLVSLIGFCEENGEMILVYDHMGNGTLREHLYKSNNAPLPWKQRLEICIGAARGLHYLHTGVKYMIIHRDVKTTNILLDEKWVAKVSDFGLSKMGPNLNQTHVSTVVKGSFGYLDPEYFRRQQLTEKSDVYSFGVVLFEVLCARPALNPSLSKDQVSLADWARLCHKKGTLEEIVDPHLRGQVSPECFNKFAETAVKCLSDHGFDRPSMGDVLWNLEFVLQLEENPDGSKLVVENKVGDDQFMHMATIELDDDSTVTADDVDKHPPVFLQIVNPTGR